MRIIMLTMLVAVTAAMLLASSLVVLPRKMDSMPLRYRLTLVRSNQRLLTLLWSNQRLLTLLRSNRLLLLSVLHGLKSGMCRRDSGFLTGIGGVLTLRFMTLRLSQAGTENGAAENMGGR